MNLFKQRQHKRFSYTPRQLKEQQRDKSYDFESQWQQKTKRKKKSPALLMLLVILGMVIVVWYVLSNYEI